MAQVTLPVRYYRLGPEGDQPVVEGNFDFATKELTIPAEQIGLVLVDCWDIHPYLSHLERGEKICQDVLAPVADSCRRAGMAVIHAPSPGQARLYPQWTKYATDAELFGTPQTSPEWPPADMRSRTGDYAQFAKEVVPAVRKWRRDDLPRRKIMELLAPQAEDFVIATGEQLHRLCRHNGIVHLIYGGFAANMCVPGRDYGTRAFGRRGYDVILLRDGTTAIEAHCTLDGMRLTEAAILETEMSIGFTCQSRDLRAACEEATGR